MQASLPFTCGKGPGNICDQNHCKLLQEKVQHQSDCTICAQDKTSLWHHGPSHARTVTSVVSVAGLETCKQNMRALLSSLWTGAWHCWKGCHNLAVWWFNSYKHVWFTRLPAHAASHWWMFKTSSAFLLYKVSVVQSNCAAGYVDYCDDTLNYS